MKDEDIADKVRRLYEKLGSIRAVGRALDLAPSSVHYHLNKKKDRTLLDAPAPKPKARRKVDIKREGDSAIVTGRGIRTLEDLLDAANLDRSWVCFKHHLNAWQALAKDSEIVQLHQVKAYLERAPEFFIDPIQPLKQYRRTPLSVKPTNKSALIIPDSQHGFRRIEDPSAENGYRWEPLHDRAAIDCVLQIADMMGPELDTIVLLGDMFDGAAFSTRWQTEPELRFTSNYSFRELYAGLLLPLRELCPHAEIIYLEGNHEKRLQDSLVAKLDEARGLRSADTLSGNEILTIESVLALDSLDIKYVGPYGAAYWLYDEIRIQHGSKARPAGETASAYLRSATSSRIWGHVHRLEMAQKKIQTKDGPKLITAASPGCLCRTDGAVPHAGGDFLDWQQGVGVVYSSGDRISVQLVPIEDGVAIFNGYTIRGDGSVETTTKRTGLRF